MNPKTPIQNLNRKRAALIRRQRTTLNRLATQWDVTMSDAQPIQERYYKELRAACVTSRAIEKQLMEEK